MGFSISAKQAVALLTLLSATVNGHIYITNPPPFAFPVESTKQSPLDPSGADFPCKFPAGFTPKEQTPTAMKAGEGANTLEFIGGATHGGGSCQISITSDTVPTKNSKWQVIKSMEGGCPSDAPGNLGNSATTQNPTTFAYTIPDDVAAGKYTLAWTWFNKIGNREMYMNCAPIEVGGGSAKREIAKINKKRQSSRPEMFVANIGNGCSTADSKDVTFPDPGQDVVKSSGVTPADPVGSCGAQGAQSAGTSPNSTSSTGGNFADSNSGGNAGGDAAGTASASAPAASSSAAVAPASGAPASDSAGSGDAAPADTDAGAASPEGAAGSSAGAGAPCSPEGMYVCAPDGSSFTRCASGVMSAPAPMAGGMKCVPGQDPSTLDMFAAKRAVRFGAEHLARSGESGY
jgi:hypothetical protein